MNAMTMLIFGAAAMAGFALFNGVVSMAHGGESDDLHANELMFKRTIWQGLAVLLVLLAMLAGVT